MNLTPSAFLAARGGNGGGVQGSTPGGAGGGGAGGCVYLRSFSGAFTPTPPVGNPGAQLLAAQDTTPPLVYGVGGNSPAAGAGGNGGDGRIRLDSGRLVGGQWAGQSTATIQPLPIVFAAGSLGVRLP
ncbi:MAG: hypothetical protein L0216_20705, partial [Planctomycetales bacterium]|nr:hypothetical protein [Planctomycetales bacterium]